MNFKYLLKASPLIFSAVLIIFLSIFNQKEYTKLRILIWNTPSLKLGNYLAISAGTGFVLSFFITTSLGGFNNRNQRENSRFNFDDNPHDISSSNESAVNIAYDKTLIERDIKEPSPTINANFRVIGRTERTNINFKNNDDGDSQYDGSLEYEEQYDYKSERNETTNQDEPNLIDWDDDSYSKW